MMSKKFCLQVLGMSLALAAAACGGTDEGTGDSGADHTSHMGPCTAPRSMCASIEVPATYASKPTKLLAALYDQLPPVGPPKKILAMVEMPDIGVGKPYALEVKDLDAQGEFFVYVAVYSEGGGPFVPVPGVDYVAQTPSKVKFDGSPMNLGSMMLHLEVMP